MSKSYAAPKSYTVPAPPPCVGMGATEVQHTDRKPYTVIAVSGDGYVVALQADKAVRIDANGMSEAQEYSYERDKDGEIKLASLRRTGRWIAIGDSLGGTHFAIGARRKYHDYSF